MTVRNFDGIPFVLVCIARNRATAEKIANKLRKEGFYARITSQGREYAVWRSLMPRWVIRWPKIF